MGLFWPQACHPPAFLFCPQQGKQGQEILSKEPCATSLFTAQTAPIFQLLNTWWLQQICSGQRPAKTTQDSPMARHCWGGSISCPCSSVPAELQLSRSLLWDGAERQREVRNTLIQPEPRQQMAGGWGWGMGEKKRMKAEMDTIRREMQHILLFMAS